MGTPKPRRVARVEAESDGARAVEAYLAALPAERREALGVLRDVVRRVFPHAHETVQYKMPTFEVSGSAQVAFASQKNHLALYLLDEDAVRRHRPRLGKVEVARGCIRFRRISDLRLGAVEALLHDAVGHR